MTIISGNSLSLKQYRALAMLLSGKSSAEIATELDIGERTLDRWKTLPDFQSLLKQSAYLCLREAVGVLAEGAADAARELVRLSKNAESEKNRIAAIQLLFTALEKGSGINVAYWSPESYEANNARREEEQRYQEAKAILNLDP